MPSFVTYIDSTLSPEQTFDRITDLSSWATFRGYGPLPGIVRAELAAGSTMGEGARVRVSNTDGSTHHEVFERFERGQRLAIRMELQPPVSRILSAIHERLEFEATATGTRVARSFELTPLAWWTAPLAWGVATLLRRAVLLHNRTTF